MKLNVKGLIFVGFAAAVFANAVQADDAKIVTSKKYVDAKIVNTASNTWSGDTDHAPSAAAVAAAISSSQNATTYTEGAGIDITNNVITNEGVRSIAPDNSTNTAAEGTITVNTNGTEAAVAVKNVEVTGHKVSQGSATGSVFTESNTDEQYPSARAVYNAVNALQQDINTNAVQADWAETVSTEPDYIKNKPGNFTAPDTINNTAGTAGFVPGPAVAQDGYVLSTDGWVDPQDSNVIEAVQVNGTGLTVNNKTVNVIVAPGSANGTVAVNGVDVAVTNVETTDHKLAQGNDTTTAVIPDASTASDTNYPTVKAVRVAIDAATAAGNGTYQAKSDANYQVSSNDGGWVALGSTLNSTDGSYNASNAVTAGAINTALADKVDANTAITAGTAPKITYDAKGLVTGGSPLAVTDIPLTNGSNVTINQSTGAIDATTGSITSTATTLVDGQTVYNYIDGLNHGLVLPAPGQGQCTANAPCALVLAGDQPTWETIQQ